MFYELPLEMTTGLEQYGKVFADFLSCVYNEKCGWWYRLPQPDFERPPIPRGVVDPFEVFPQFGSLFGLSEEAMTMILAEMGCIRMIGGQNKVQCVKHGWDQFGALFQVDDLIEVQKTEISYFTSRKQLNKIRKKGVGNESKKVWFIRLGTIGLNPSKILTMVRNDRTSLSTPRKISNRVATAFLSTQLVSILKDRGSGVFDLFLTTAIYSFGNKLDGRTKRNNLNTNSTTLSNELNGRTLTGTDESMTDETAMDWHLRMGTRACKNTYPVLHKFNIPTDNEQTLNEILCEVLKLKAKKLSGVLMFDVKERNGNDAHYIRIPSRKGKHGVTAIGRATKLLLSGRSEADTKEYPTAMLNVIEKEHEDTFLQVCKDNGYTSQRTPCMTAIFWVAMSEEANLRLNQQRIVNKYLLHHFGHRVCVPETNISEIGSSFIPYTCDQFKHEGKKINYSHRKLTELLNHYSLVLFDRKHLEEIEKVEVLLGGDHGKGAFTFLAIIIIRFKTTKEPLILDLQIGQIDSQDDKLELLRPLVGKIGDDIRTMPQQSDGCVNLEVLVSDYEYKLVYGENSESGEVISTKVKLELFLIGDFKFLFTMMGRDGFSGHHCLYCRMKASEWKAKHEETKEINCEADFWTIMKLSEQSLLMQQGDDEAKGQGLNEPPLWDFIPVTNILVPILHILLGLGNDTLSKFWDWVDERVEKKSNELIQARNFHILADIAVDECKENVEAISNYLSEAIQRRS